MISAQALHQCHIKSMSMLPAAKGLQRALTRDATAVQAVLPAGNNLKFRVFCEGDADGITQPIHEQGTDTNGGLHAPILALPCLCHPAACIIQIQTQAGIAYLDSTTKLKRNLWSDLYSRDVACRSCKPASMPETLNMVRWKLVLKR